VLAGVLDDPDRRARMAERGRVVVAPYDWEEVSRRVLEVYHLAVEASPRNTRPDPVSRSRRRRSA
jgi:phosphatidylinositol alpha-mannosyltransferase